MSRNITKDVMFDRDYEYRNYSDYQYDDFYVDDDDEIVSVNYEEDDNSVDRYLDDYYKKHEAEFDVYLERIRRFEEEGK